MSYNGSGTFNINSTGQPVVSGTVISSTVFNALTADLATGLSTCITKDGQTTVSANIPMNSFKFTGLAAGTAATDSVRVGQLQAGGATLVTVTGTDTYAGSMSPALAAYAAGNTFTFVVPNTNTTSCTLNIDGLGAKAITRDGSTALIAGDLVSGAEVAVVYDGTRFQVLNSNSKTNFNVSSTLTANALTTTSTVTINGGTANGVAYLNGSKVLTTGSALTFDGTNFQVGGNSQPIIRAVSSSTNNATARIFTDGDTAYIGSANTSTTGGSVPVVFQVGGTEQMRLNSTGLGIGTSSPARKLDVNGSIRITDGQTIEWGGTSLYIAGTSNTLLFGTSSAERMRLDSLGNLGLGVTPSAWSATYKAVQIGQSALMSRAGGADSYLLTNSYYDGTNYRYINTSYATKYQQDTGVHSWFNAPSGTAGNAISFTQAMTLDASGNLGVGITSPATVLHAAGSTGLTLGAITGNAWRTAAIVAIDEGASFKGTLAFYTHASAGAAGAPTERARINSSGYFGIGTTNPLQPLVISNAGAQGFEFVPASGIMQTYNRSGAAYTDMRFDASQVLFFTGSSPSERARIESGGAFLLGRTSQFAQASKLIVEGNSNTTAICGIFNDARTDAASAINIAFYRNGTKVGSVDCTNAATSYVTSSDQRLKENIQPAQNSGAVIDAINVVEFDWKVGGHVRYGVIAQELLPVAPEAVSAPENPDEMMGVDYSKLVPMLVKEIQDLRARISVLENK